MYIQVDCRSSSNVMNSEFNSPRFQPPPPPPPLSLSLLQEELRIEELEDVRSQVDVMSAEVASLKAALAEREGEVQAKETLLKEMKNMNAALENQLTEYVDALDHQNQVGLCWFFFAGFFGVHV